MVPKCIVVVAVVVVIIVVVAIVAVVHPPRLPRAWSRIAQRSNLWDAKKHSSGRLNIRQVV